MPLPRASSVEPSQQVVTREHLFCPRVGHEIIFSSVNACSLRYCRAIWQGQISSSSQSGSRKRGQRGRLVVILSPLLSTNIFQNTKPVTKKSTTLKANPVTKPKASASKTTTGKALVSKASAKPKVAATKGAKPTKGATGKKPAAPNKVVKKVATTKKIITSKKPSETGKKTTTARKGAAKKVSIVVTAESPKTNKYFFLSGCGWCRQKTRRKG